MKKTLFITTIIILLMAGCGSPPAKTATTTPTMISPYATFTSTPLSPTTAPPPLPSSTSLSKTTSLSAEAAFQKVSAKWRVAYWDYKNNQICAVYGDGSGKLCTTVKDMEGFRASWSQAGDRIIFSNGLRLKIWQPGGGVTPLLNISGVFNQPAWSPDGKTIAFISDELQRSMGQSYAMDIFIHSLDGSVHRNMTTNLAANSEDPSWSPDGRKIAFGGARIVDNIDPAILYPKVYADKEIYVVNIDDPSRVVDLTNNKANDTYPVWSPDGLAIAFLSDRASGTFGKYQLFIMKPDGSDQQRVSDADLGGFNEFNSPFTWLPDEKQILIGDKLISVATGKMVQLQFQFTVEGSAWLMVNKSVPIAAVPTPNCTAGWSQLFTGANAVVPGAASDPPNRVRSGPSKSAAVVYQLYPQTIVKVVEGPVCADGLVFWRVENAGIPGGSGWTAEGDGKDYYLVPIQ